MQIGKTGAAGVNKSLKSGMKVMNEAGGEVKDSFTPSSSATEEISFKKPSFKKEKYEPHYSYGRVTDSCGAAMRVEWAETRDLKDQYKIRDQLGINVVGLPKETPEDYASSKEFTGLSKHKYEYGRVLPPSCGDFVTVGWGTTMSHEKAEKIAKENKIRLIYPGQTGW